MNIQELLNGATQEDLRVLQAKLDESKAPEKLGKRIVRIAVPVLGTAMLASAVTYVMTRNHRKAIKAIDQKLDHLLAGASDDNVVPMGKTGTR